MEDNIQIKLAEDVASDAYITLGKYTAKTRNYPGMVDGMKMAYRRLIYQSRVHTKLVKAATLVGDGLKINPHGDESLYSVLVECACRYNAFPLYESKGNFGGLGFGAAAMRYPEATLSDIARLMYLELIDYAEYEDGEVDNKEPKYLPALIPYCFLAGCSGFSVGMPAPNIPQYNLMDLINYYINLLEGKSTEYPAPDYGAVILNCNKKEYSDYLLSHGEGSLWYKPFVVQEDYNKLVVTQLTPGKSIDKVNSKLCNEISQGWVDFINETSEEGYRFVYIINNFNKVSVDYVKSSIEKALSCSQTYRLMFEYDSTVHWCSIDKVISTQLDYLRGCTVRKYNDYYHKSEHKSEVLKAISKLKSEESVVSSMHKLEKSELISIIVGWGFSESAASSVLDKSISYLTKSHDKEYNDEIKNQELYKDYIDHPDKYLLSLYYRLKDMVSEFYKSRSHSIFIDDIESSRSNRCQLSDNHKLIEFGNDKLINWNNMIYAITKKGYILPVSVNKINMSSIELIDPVVDTDEYIALVSDHYKYIIMITYGKYISVIPTSKVRSGLNEYVKLWESTDVFDCVVGSNDDIKFIDERGKEINIHCEDYVKSRISKPQGVSSKNLSYYISEDGAKIEI